MTKLKLNQAQIELARDVLTNAIETGAIGYWTCNQEWSRKDGVDGEMITRISFEVRDENTDAPIEPRTVYTITEEKVIEAMKTIAIENAINPDLHKRITGMWAADDYLAGEGGDSESDDVIVQVAALGRVTFG